MHSLGHNLFQLMSEFRSANYPGVNSRSGYPLLVTPFLWFVWSLVKWEPLYCGKHRTRNPERTDEQVTAAANFKANISSTRAPENGWCSDWLRHTLDFQMSRLRRHRLQLNSIEWEISSAVRHSVICKFIE